MKRPGGRATEASGVKSHRAVSSLLVALASFIALSALCVAVFREMTERTRLESRNDTERTLSMLLASLKDHEDFGSAVEASPRLSASVLGIGIYDGAGTALYSWGAAPATLPSSGEATDSGPREEHGRIYRENPANGSLILLVDPSMMGPPPPRPAPGASSPEVSQDPAPRIAGATAPELPEEGKAESPSGDARGGDAEGAPGRDAPAAEGDGPGAPRPRLPFFETLRRGELFYLELAEPRYWRMKRLVYILFPISELVLAALLVFVRSLVLRNAEYRERIEEQKNLVILGTAASTLAHEIKNPLLAIRLQTSILEKTCSGTARRELDIINAEVDRLSALTYRVNDYLRDPRGKPQRVDALALAREVATRLDREGAARALDGGRHEAFVDPERLRSMLENLVRNALESGGDPAEVEVVVSDSEGSVVIDVLDRGTGIDREARARIFQPFFTTKARGTGIGLAITKRFAEASGGSVAIEAREGGGTRARIVLQEARA